MRATNTWITFDCPTCGAVPGDKCRAAHHGVDSKLTLNYPVAPHDTRRKLGAPPKRPA